MTTIIIVPRREDTRTPRYVCPKCGMIEYCRTKNGAPRFPETTLKAMQKKHKLVCDSIPEYRAGLLPASRPCGQ